MNWTLDPSYPLSSLFFPNLKSPHIAHDPAFYKLNGGDNVKNSRGGGGGGSVQRQVISEKLMKLDPFKRNVVVAYAWNKCLTDLAHELDIALPPGLIQPPPTSQAQAHADITKKRNHNNDPLVLENLKFMVDSFLLDSTIHSSTTTTKTSLVNEALGQLKQLFSIHYNIGDKEKLHVHSCWPDLLATVNEVKQRQQGQSTLPLPLLISTKYLQKPSVLVIPYNFNQDLDKLQDYFVENMDRVSGEFHQKLEMKKARKRIKI